MRENQCNKKSISGLRCNNDKLPFSKYCSDHKPIIEDGVIRQGNKVIIPLPRYDVYRKNRIGTGKLPIIGIEVEEGAYHSW